MMRHAKLPVSALLAAVLALGGCSSRVSQARLYSLTGPDRIDVTLAFDGERAGVLSATLPTGERCEGEFVLWATREGQMFETEEEWVRLKSLVQGGGSTEWSQIYGFAEGADAQPVGTGVLKGPRGTTLEIVFYHATVEYHLRGDGLARDNDGRWYRVILGPEPGGLGG